MVGINQNWVKFDEFSTKSLSLAVLSNCYGHLM